MKDTDVAKYWDRNADAWTQLSRAGYNISRDLLNTPALLELLCPTRGQRVLDIGCGDGDLTRRLARGGACAVGIDLSEKFLQHAQSLETADPLGIQYVLGSAQELPFPDASFDAVTGMMSFMDMPRPDLAIAHAQRVLKPGGVLAFAITHPCFQTARWEWVHDKNNQRIGVICGDYFSPAPNRVDVWTFGAAPADMKKRLEKFRIPRFDFTLSWWINTLIGSGFSIDRMIEPNPDDDLLLAYPELRDNRIVAYFLHFRCVKNPPQMAKP